MPRISYKTAVVWASGTFLTDELPLNWEQLDNDGNLWKYISENAWQPFENMDPHEVFDNICVLADGYRNDMNRGKCSVTG